jgi:hypothetical protein
MRPHTPPPAIAATADLPAPDLGEIMMHVVDALLEQGWEPAAIAKAMQQAGHQIQVMDRVRGIAQ